MRVSFAVIAASAVATLLAVNFPGTPAMAAGATCISTGGDVSHTGTDGSSCDANSDGTSGATAISARNSTADATVKNGGPSTALSNVDSDAQSESDADCASRSIATDGSDADSLCTKSGGKASAKGARGGSGTAESDE